VYNFQFLHSLVHFKCFCVCVAIRFSRFWAHVKRSLQIYDVGLITDDQVSVLFISPKAFSTNWMKIDITSIFSTEGGPIWITFRWLVQNNMSTPVMWSKSKPDVEFHYSGRLGEFNGMSSQSYLPHRRVLPPTEFNVMIPELRDDLEANRSCSASYDSIPVEYCTTITVCWKSARQANDVAKFCGFNFHNKTRA